MKMLSQGTEYISKIREARIRHGLTQKQVSDITGVPLRSIENWEAGVRKCPNYVEKMVVDILNQKFGEPDYKTILEEVLVMVKRGEARTHTAWYIEDKLNK